ncbi:hypothetical protein AKJ09_09608 [Labilithrix luteola]|uniref:Uncharacterized protein n=1 Tax=Labilithrix luteola TaxID=1391654 RepID=A0A0K1QBY8_9BACT|nr:hypothetical protein [Labilithrix luteola]AKV02945.1 hypothetical protein AKJ09_09608 [Labilithrix luteola]
MRARAVVHRFPYVFSGPNRGLTRSLVQGLSRAIGFGFAFGALVACSRGEPPAPMGIDAAVAPLPAPAAASSDANAATDASTATTGATAAAGADGGVDPGTLPQTHDKPKASGPAFDARIAALWEGIAKDDPDLALPAFFPVTAYEQVKAIPSPSSDWRRRLVAAYKRDIHALHKRLGDSADRAKLVRAEVPDDRARWVDPNEETNKLGYYRVYGTRMIYEVDGKERGFDVSSLISWRGEWYVVHLTGFK